MGDEELDEIRRIIQTLQVLGENYLSHVGLGDIPLSDSNGESLGVIGYLDGNYVYYPGGTPE